MRKESIIEIEDNGNPLKFKIKQMPATKQQKFLLKLILLATKSGVAGAIDVPDSVSIGELSVKDLNVTSVLSKIGTVDYESVEPLIHELLGCCSRITDGGSEIVCTPATIDGYVDDVRTLFKLEMEAAKLNFSFFQGAASSRVSAPKADITISKPIKM